MPGHRQRDLGIGRPVLGGGGASLSVWDLGISTPNVEWQGNTDFSRLKGDTRIPHKIPSSYWRLRGVGEWVPLLPPLGSPSIGLN